MNDAVAKAPETTGQPRLLRDALLGLALVAAYFLAARVGLSLAFVNSSTSAVWPPTGIAIAALVVLGLRFWPAILVGAFLANLDNSGHWPSAFAIGIGNMLEGLAAAYAIRQWAKGPKAFENPRDTFTFIVACLAGPLISASVGVATLVQFGLAPAELARSIWTTWYLGDVAGAIVVAPPLILVAQRQFLLELRPRWIETTLVLVTTGIVADLIWGPHSQAVFAGRPFAFASLPVVVWGALRLGPLGTSLNALVLGAVAVWGTLGGHGPFAVADTNTALLYLQFFLGVVALMTLPIAALARQQQASQAQLREAAQRLESQVEARTAELRTRTDALERAEQHAQSLLDAAPDGTVVVDETGRILRANGEAARLFGYTQAELLALNVDALVPDAVRPRHAGLRTSFLADAKVRPMGAGLNLLARRKDGSLVPVEISLSPLRTATGIQVIAAIRDVTVQREAQESQRKTLASVQEAERVTGRGSWEWDITKDKAVWSDGMYRLFGLDPKTFVNSNENFLAMVLPEDRDRMGQAIADALAKPGRFFQEYRLRRPDGQVRWVQGEGNVVPDPDGKARLVYGIVQDVTEIKLALDAERRAQERFRLIFTASPVAISLSRADGTILDVNDAFCRVCGYDRQELLARSFRATTLYDDPDERSRMLVALRETGALRETEFRWRRKDGALRTVLGSLEFVDVGGGTTILGLFQDVTERNQAQKEREARIASEAELERLRRSDKFRTEFINSTAHELSTPLTPLVLNLHTFGADTTLTATQRRTVESMQRNVARLKHVVDEMLGAADLQARSMALDRRRLNLNRELKAAVAANHNAAERARIQLLEPEDGGETVSADPQRLQLVLGHLLGNAIKFTPAGGKVWIATRRTGIDEVRVSINDTGIGLTPKQMEGLWKPFAQAHDKAQRTDSGSGLGLYVTKGIIDLHGGEVGCTSPGPGKGSTFWFTLPLATGHIDPLSKPVRDEPKPSEPRRNLNPGVHDEP